MSISDSITDFNHQLYLHPSDTPGTLLVDHQLLGVENYNVWSRMMKIALLAKNKLGFVDGIVFASSAAAVWSDLSERFHKIDGSRIYFLHREITSSSQSTVSISAYFTKLRLLWDEYDALVRPFACGCPQSRQNVKHVEQQHLFQFLMGLNDSYSAVRSQILLISPLPSVNHAYSMLMQEESQRKHSSSTIGDDLVFFSSVQMVHNSAVNNVFAPDSVCSSEVVGSHKSRLQVPVFTQEQYNQILYLLNKEPVVVEAAASLAGMPDISNRWIIDTGATDHILSDLRFLDSPVACEFGSPSDLSSGKMRGIGKARGGLYILDLSRQTSVVSPSSVITVATVDSSFLWHTRLGHASVLRLNKICGDPIECLLIVVIGSF
ncbi:uncharacterized protein [Gossypium hirsutum]|uniref:Retrotransposon Copia-like N-terminal domain-containing protein n=1 Tax=Gossypium hirsutum TaxID=3635 RepID=A0ABM3AAB6_GOSHI|nr:uncharacterized protein LOC107942720 [Gossypium hirsutum]